MTLKADSRHVYQSGTEASLGGGAFTGDGELPPKYQPEGPSPVDTTKFVKKPENRISTTETVVEPTAVTKASIPFRELRIGNATVDVDFDVWVRGGEIGAKTAEINLWNISSETWTQIVHGIPVEVEVGWRETDSTTIFRGFHRHKRRDTLRGDRKYIITASSNDYSKLSSGFAGSWNNVAPHRIAQYMADKAGFETRYISHESDPIDSWTISSRRELKHWMDKLSRRAGRAASSSKHEGKWVWYTDGNKFSFHSTAAQPETPRILETGSSLLRAAPTETADGSDVDDYAEISFDCRMEPWLHRGSVVKFKGVRLDPDRLYRVKTITFETSTTKGRHHVHGKASPVRVVDESQPRAEGQLPPQRPEKDRVFRNTTPTRD